MRAAQVELDPEALSPEARAALREIAVPLACGMTELEIARHHGIGLKEVRRRLEVLRAELSGGWDE